MEKAIGNDADAFLDQQRRLLATESMLDSEYGPVRAQPLYSFEQAILEGLEHEMDDATQDTGPIDSERPEDLQRLRAEFYGTIPAPQASRPASPVGSPPPPPSTTADPGLAEYETFGGDSPLSSHASSRSQSPTQPPTERNGRRMRNKTRSRNKRAKRRRREREEREGEEEHVGAPHSIRAHTIRTHVIPAEEMAVEYGAEDIPSASTGYIALRDSARGVYDLKQLLGKGFHLVKWDGRTPRPIVDRNGLVVAVLVGQPNDPSWPNVHEEAFRLLEDSYERCDFTTKCVKHRRGKFAALNYGISFGGGQTLPGNLSHNEARAEVLQGLVDSTSFTRLAGFASSSFSAWMPKLHQHYKTCLDCLVHHDRNLRPNFDNSVWGAAAFNFGPRTVTARHRDSANLPFGVCSITALGEFDYVEGGHAVLWEFGLVIEFPPGSTILIPSAAVTHSNTPVGAHERRGSFTQYSAGGLFRWVDQGHQSTEDYMASLSPEEVEGLKGLNEARCKLGMSLFSTLDELRAPPK